jgi:hypothetical protein
LLNLELIAESIFLAKKGENNEYYKTFEGQVAIVTVVFVCCAVVHYLCTTSFWQGFTG